MIPSLRKTLYIILAAITLLFISCDERRTRLEYLVRDASLHGYYSLGKDSVTMYRSPADKQAGRAECVLYRDEYAFYGSLFRSMDLAELRDLYLAKGTGRFPEVIRNRLRPSVPFTTGRKGKPLAGMVVALDPGHTARSFEEGQREGKYLLLRDGDRTIRFYEAELNLRTALLLGSMLETDGAAVVYTRHGDETPGYALSPATALDMGWISADMAARISRGTATTKELFHYYTRVSDLARRAAIINTACSHLTLSIHYNMTFSPGDSRRRLNEIQAIIENFGSSDREKVAAIDDVIRGTGESDVNYSVVFVPGAFMAGELDGVEARMNFLRLMVTDDLEKSVMLGSCVADEFRNALDIPRPGQEFSCRDNRYTGVDGVFARNFRMTRLVAGPVCLGEPLIQNYPAEARSLANVSSGEVPERITRVAAAYHRAVLKYAKRMR